jgi:membrane fusion protein
LSEAARGSGRRFKEEDSRLAEKAAAALADANRIAASRDLALGRLAIAERAESQARTLIERGYMSATEGDRRAQEAISVRSQIGELDRQIASVRAQAVDFEGQRLSLRAAHNAEMADISRQRTTLNASKTGEVSDISRQRAALKPALDAEASQLRIAKTQLETGLTELSIQDGYVVRAPISGRVSTVNIRAGEAVRPNIPLVTISPKGSPLEAQIVVPTRAAGFISEGQKVRLMVDAFPYQQYGILQGQVRQISRSAVKPGELNAPIELKEPVYVVRVTIKDQSINAYGVLKPLQSGMTLKADILTDKRTLLAWLFDPLLAARARAE